MRDTKPILKGGGMMREFTFEELKERRPSNLVISEGFSRQTRIRRKPRDPVERELLIRQTQARVKEAERQGKLVYDGQRIIIRF